MSFRGDLTDSVCLDTHLARFDVLHARWTNESPVVQTEDVRNNGSEIASNCRKSRIQNVQRLASTFLGTTMSWRGVLVESVSLRATSFNVSPLSDYLLSDYLLGFCRESACLGIGFRPSESDLTVVELRPRFDVAEQVRRLLSYWNPVAC